ncbi:unnamed protein product [Urochloa decumbens]|uniref:DUF3615 domain-containing protein n=1 Tax=Urochloa decumbens TaxID=240449 RepID=A0ABC9B125_9POAL
MSQLFEKLDLEVYGDSICSKDNVAQVGTYPIVEGGISAEISRAKVKKGGLDDEEYIDWMIEILKKGGHNDILSCYNLDEGEKHHVHNVPDEFCDPLDKEANDYCKSTERVSKKEIIKKGIKWMSEECFLAFTTYAEKINLEGIEHKFGELRYQCLSVEAYDKIFHHYNFTIEAKHRNSGVSTSELYFAEVKQLAGDKSYFCCLLEQSDEGHCYGCKNQDMYDLKHPNTGCYEEGDADICWPFIDVTDSDSDDGDDCGGLGC